MGNLLAPSPSHSLKTLVVGVAFAGMGLVLAGNGSLHAYAAHRRFVDLQPVTCVIVDKRITQGIGEHIWDKHSSTPYEAWARVRYSVGGVSHEAAGDLFPENRTESGRPPSEVLTGMPVGSAQPAWVDPSEPRSVLLSKGYDTAASYLLMIVGGAVFAIIGLACIAETIVTLVRAVRWEQEAHGSTPS